MDIVLVKFLGQVAAVAFAVTCLLSYPILQLLRLTRSRQTIDPHAPETHQRKQGTPTMGGIMVLGGAMLALLIAPKLGMGSGGNLLPESPQPLLLAYILTLFLFGVIGFIDDFVVPRMFKKRGLGWMPKIIMQVAAGATVASIAFPGDVYALLFGLFCILLYSNAYNFADGLDGLSGSIWLTLSVGLLPLFMMSSGTLAEASTVAAICGGMIVFLFYNAPPAKVFMGDVGSLPIGACLGLMLSRQIISTGGAGSPSLAPIFILSLLLFAELFPVPMQVAYYKLTKKRLFPMTPIHHGFEKKGWPESRVVWTFALFQLVCSLVAILCLGRGQT